MKELELKVKQYSPDLYSFSHALIPDDLQAGQIVIDAISTQLIEDRQLITDILDNNEDIESYANKLKISLFSKSYVIAKKRFDQIKMSIKIDSKEEAIFSRLKIPERAVLFLHYKLKLDMNEISDILDVDIKQVSVLLEMARNKVEKTGRPEFVKNL